MPRRNRPIARQWPLAAAYAGGLWLATLAWVASVQLVVTHTQWRRFGLPEHAWMPWPALLPALPWCVLGSAPMVLPVARVTGDIRKGNP